MRVVEGKVVDDDWDSESDHQNAANGSNTANDIAPNFHRMIVAITDLNKQQGTCFKKEKVGQTK